MSLAQPSKVFGSRLVRRLRERSTLRRCGNPPKRPSALSRVISLSASSLQKRVSQMQKRGELVSQLGGVLRQVPGNGRQAHPGAVNHRADAAAAARTRHLGRALGRRRRTSSITACEKTNFIGGIGIKKNVDANISFCLGAWSRGGGAAVSWGRRSAPPTSRRGCAAKSRPATAAGSRTQTDCVPSA